MALLTALLAAGPASGLGELLFFCSMSGQLGPKCCCPHEVEEDALSEPALREAPCCELVSSEPPVLPTRLDAQGSRLAPPHLIALPVASSPRARVRGPIRLAAGQRARGPPPNTGPPLFLQHCAYLI